MSVSRMRVMALGLATAGGLAAAGWLMAVQLPAAAAKSGDALPAKAPEQFKPVGAAAEANGGSGVRVDAPGTNVAVDKDSGKVSVAAPYADVRVDPDKGRVKVRAPYVNLDVDW